MRLVEVTNPPEMVRGACGMLIVEFLHSGMKAAVVEDITPAKAVSMQAIITNGQKKGLYPYTEIDAIRTNKKLYLVKKEKED